MNLYMEPEKLKERCKDPAFCIVCLCSRHDVPVDKHHVCAECRQGKDDSMPRRLPVVTLENGKTYFVDERLKELRNVLKPYDSIDFNELRRINMNPDPDAIITVSCTTCSKILFKGSRRQAKGLILYCVDC
jgi:hypothetical protein